MPRTNFYNTNLPADLRVLKDEIEAHARGYGLDFYETIFEVVTADDLNEIAAYGGFPTRYPHWSFGMQYEELKRSYEYGLSKIYEMVINNDPCYAYLMRCNHTVDQKLVMAHVYGHCDFFKNNAFFGHTTRKMMDEIANHGSRIRRYVERFGEDEVEGFLDRCQSIDDLIDIHSVAIKRRDEPNRFEFKSATDEGGEEARPLKFKSKAYLDGFINPRTTLDDDEAARLKSRKDVPNFPDHPEKDVLLFLIEHAPLKHWQRDVLSIVRDEAYYFYPQAQTKIMNEGWACVAGDTLIPTSCGFLPAAEIAFNKLAISVSDGTGRQPIYDWAEFADRETVTVRTRRGLTLTGSTTHRVMTGAGDWKRLDELVVGDRLAVARGADLWAADPVALRWSPTERLTVEGLCGEAGVSVRTLYRHLDGRRVRSAAVLEPLVARHREELASQGMTMAAKRAPVRIPPLVDERFGAFLGYLIGDGHISDVKRTLGLTTGDGPQADHFAELVEDLFGIRPRRKWDESKWRVGFSSGTVRDFLVSLGLETGRAARRKAVPECILRSPGPVVAAFLRALYDCDGYAGPHGVILATSSDRMGEVVQQLLLNFGVLSTRRLKEDGCWHVRTQGASAKVFGERIGFRLERKAARLRRYVEDRKWFRAERPDDTVVSIIRGRGDVFDFSVRETHRYAAAGLLNHNSYWHSTIMTQNVLEPSEMIDYADHHSGTMATSGKRLNPYKLGLELLRDIEYRWDTGRFGPEWDACDDAEARRAWHRPTGLGRQKIFEVRRVFNDLTFIDTFLTPEFCQQHKLFSFAYQNPTKNYVVESREFDTVKRRLLSSLTNFGKPWIEVLNGNHRNRGELLLRHRFGGVELKRDEARDTLANLRYVWGRPVHLETVVDDKPTLLSFDGQEHTQQAIGGDHEPSRDAAKKPR